MLTTFRKVLLAVAFVAGLSASAVYSTQVVTEVGNYHLIEA